MDPKPRPRTARPAPRTTSDIDKGGRRTADSTTLVTNGTECQGGGGGHGPQPPPPTAVAAYILRERRMFERWLARMHDDRATADSVLADAVLRAQFYSCPEDIDPSSAAWRHVRLARADHYRSVARHCRRLAAVAEVSRMAPTRFVTPEEQVLLREASDRLRQHLDAAAPGRGKRNLRCVMHEFAFGPYRAPEEQAAALGISLNRLFKLRGAARRIVAQVLAQL